MLPANPTPTVSPSGLVTVAYLKAQLDDGSDHLGMFFPLVLSVIPQLNRSSFASSDVQEAIDKHHGIAMPREAISTLLKRAVRKRLLERDAGRYQVVPGRSLPRYNVSAEKEQIERHQIALAMAFQEHAARRKLTLESPEAALQLLFRFIRQEQVPLLLGVASPESRGAIQHPRREA